MKYTENLALRKPEGVDTVEVNDFNHNNDILDAVVSNISETATEANQIIKQHTETDNPHGISKEKLQLDNVDNVKQMPIAGGTFTGVTKAQTNTLYSTAQLRNVIISSNNPSGGNNGDIWVKFDV